MYKLIKKGFPNLAPKLHIIIGRFYDIYKFTKHCSSVSHIKSQHKLRAYITRQYHGLEKGLSYTNTRPGFGKVLALELCKNIRLYVEGYGIDHVVQHGINTLKNYRDFNAAYIDSTEPIMIRIEELIKKVEFDSNSSFRLMSKEEVTNSTDFDFSSFVKTRRSVRDFAEKDVDVAEVKEAILDAMEAPSACNRQGWRVRIYKGDDKNNILKYQNGNRGFNHLIDKVILVTGYSEVYSYTERNGMFVDGSLFAMMLILALHSRNIGVCPLNTSYTYKEEIRLRKGINLPTNEEPIMMMALGHLKDNYKVASSPRLKINEVLIED